MSLSSRALIFSWLAFVAPPALAAGDPDAAKPIVANYCSACHLVPGYQRTFPPTSGIEGRNPPPFTAIAADPVRYSDEALRAFLAAPHFPMKNIILSKRDIENLIAFIRALPAD